MSTNVLSKYPSHHPRPLISCPFRVPETGVPVPQLYTLCPAPARDETPIVFVRNDLASAADAVWSLLAPHAAPRASSIARGGPRRARPPLRIQEVTMRQVTSNPVPLWWRQENFQAFRNA